jgi:hypothetical protein
MKIRKSGSWIVVFLLWAVTPAALFGQNVYGKIAGVVSDNSGASVGGCAVTLTNLDTDTSNQVTTDPSGNYSFPSIAPGRYKIQAEKTGFKIYIREPIIVEIESGLKIDIALAVGTAPRRLR